MGEVVEVASPNHTLKQGDRVVVPFNIHGRDCIQCKPGNWSCGLISNRNADMAAKMFGYSTSGLLCHAHLKRYMETLTGLLQNGTIDSAFLITHRARARRMDRTSIRRSSKKTTTV